MKIEVFTVACQVYVIPTSKITYTRLLNGSLEIQFIWLTKGISISF